MENAPPKRSVLRLFLWVTALFTLWFLLPAAAVVAVWRPGTVRPIDGSVIEWTDIALQIVAMNLLSILVLAPLLGAFLWFDRSRRRRLGLGFAEQQWLLQLIGAVLCVEGVLLLAQQMIWPRFVMSATSLAGGLLSLLLGATFLGSEFWRALIADLTSLGRPNADGVRRKWSPVRIILALGAGYLAVGVFIAVVLTAMSVHPLSVFPKIVVGWPLFVALHAKRVLPGL